MKQEFDFYIDERVMIWNRLKFSVKAETLEEAIDGIINDTYDCSREGTRCVYGYYKLTNKN